MCIICTGEIYKQNLDTLQVLNVSDCESLTSERLQEVLVQCKNLTILRCAYCTSLTSIDLRKNIKLKNLMCHTCKLLEYINFSSDYNCLEEIRFYNTLVRNIDISKCQKLDYIICSELLDSIDFRECKELTSVNISDNNNITTIDLRENKKLSDLYCNNCRLLTSVLIDNPSELAYENYEDDPWIYQNEDFSSNLQSLIKIQRWYRRLLVIKYMKSQEFIEWIYNPNIGGKYYKNHLLKLLTV